MSFLSLRTRRTTTTNTNKGFSFLSRCTSPTRITEDINANRLSNVTAHYGGKFYSVGGNPSVRDKDRVCLRGGSSGRGGEDIDGGVHEVLDETISSPSAELEPQPMQEDMTRRPFGAGFGNTMSTAIQRLPSPKLRKKRQYGERSATPKTQPTDKDIGRAVLDLGENNELRGEVGEVDNIDAEDMYMEFGSLEEDDNNNKKKAAKVSVTEHIIDNTTNFAQGDLLDVYNGLLAEYDPTKDDGDYYLSTFRLGIIEFTHWTQQITDTTDNKLTNDAHYYTQNHDELLELELKLNTKRGKVIELIEKHLPEYSDLINVCTKFSILTRILHKLHYSPEGTTPDPDDPHNHSPFFQCCVATMMTKLLNFLINEDELRKGDLSEEEIVAKMTELMSYGGNPKELNKDLHEKQVICDLTIFDLEKKKKKGEMEKQYKTWAGPNRCNLNSMWELFTIMYNIDRLHMLLHRAAHPGETLQVHCSSAATAFYGFNLKAGTDKYATKFVGTGSNGNIWYVITFGGHAQTYLMGLNKSLRMFPKGIREIIAQHLIELYSVVYEFETFSREGFTTCLMDVFGGNSKDGVDVGEYACLARLLEESGLLDLKKADIKSGSVLKKLKRGPTPFSTDKLIGKLQEKDWNRANIERLLVQLKEANDDFDLMMRRMKQFRAGARLHYIAAQLLELGDGSVVDRSNDSIPPHITTMIEEVTEVLQQKDVSDTWKSLVKIQNNQLKGGKRLAKLQQLAAEYNRTGEIDKEELKKLLKLLKDERTEEEAMAMIKGAALLQDDGGKRLALFSQLASLYNKKGGEDGEGLNAITEDSRLGELVSLMSGDTTMAIDAIVSIANQCSKTFWENFEKLKKYRKDNPDHVVEVEVSGEMVRVLTVEVAKGKSLHQWLVTQNGHTAEKQGYECGHSIKAYERMGSIEQLALSGIDVTFEPKVHQKAMDKRWGDKTKEGVSEGRSGFMGRMLGNKKN